MPDRTARECPVLARSRATCDAYNSVAIEGKADATRPVDSVAIDPTLPYQRLHKISTCGVGLAATLMGRSRAHAARIMTGFLTCIFVHGAITGWNWSRKRVALRNGKCAFWRRQKRCRGRQTRA
jgi:hypothetical protein